MRTRVNEFELMAIARQIAEIAAKAPFTIRDDEIFSRQCRDERFLARGVGAVTKKLLGRYRGRSELSRD